MTRKYVETLPDFIKIGAYDVPIQKVETIRSDGKECWGLFHDGTISIVLDHPSRGHVAGVFIHECFHAMWDMAALEARATEEKVVHALSASTIGLFRDNKPWLLSWLKKAL